MQLLDPPLNVGQLHPQGVGDPLLGLYALRQKFVQGRVNQADGDRQILHGRENSLEIAALKR